MSTTASAQRARLPRQVPYIIGNEAAERFIMAECASAFPSAAFVGEELVAARPAAGAGAPTTSRLLRAAMDDRPVSWVASPRFVVALRKFKSFSRGGYEMEVFPLQPPK